MKVLLHHYRSTDKNFVDVCITIYMKHKPQTIEGQDYKVKNV